MRERAHSPTRTPRPGRPGLTWTGQVSHTRLWAASRRSSGSDGALGVECDGAWRTPHGPHRQDAFRGSRTGWRPGPARRPFRRRTDWNRRNTDRVDHRRCSQSRPPHVPDLAQVRERSSAAGKVVTGGTACRPLVPLVGHRARPRHSRPEPGRPEAAPSCSRYRPKISPHPLEYRG